MSPRDMPRCFQTKTGSGTVSADPTVPLRLSRPLSLPLRPLDEPLTYRLRIEVVSNARQSHAFDDSS